MHNLKSLYIHVTYGILLIFVSNSVCADEANMGDRGSSVEAANSASLFDNLRWAIDQSSLHKISLEGEGSAWQHAIGLDLHKVFQNDTGDFGTLVFSALPDQIR